LRIRRIQRRVSINSNVELRERQEIGGWEGDEVDRQEDCVISSRVVKK
jgi:hypothetical protein